MLNSSKGVLLVRKICIELWSMMKTSEYLSAISEIEKAAVLPGHWPSVLKRLRDASDATWCGLISERQKPRAARIEALVGLDTPSQDLYEAYYCNRSLLGRHLSKLPEMSIFADHMYPWYDRYRRCEARNDFFKPRDGTHILATNLVRGGSANSYICFRRSSSLGCFPDESVEWLRNLAPYLKNALDVSALLESERHKAMKLTEALESLPIGVILADSQGQIVAANAKADFYLSRDHLQFKICGAVRGVKSSIAAAVCAQQGKFGEPNSTKIRTLQIDGVDPSLEFLVFPVSQETTEACELRSGEVAAIIFIQEVQSSSKIPTALLEVHYGLTPAEARLTSQLVAVGSLSEAALVLGITGHTARSTAKKVYGKTGAKGQADLVRILLSGLARFTIN